MLWRVLSWESWDWEIKIQVTAKMTFFCWFLSLYEGEEVSGLESDKIQLICAVRGQQMKFLNHMGPTTSSPEKNVSNMWFCNIYAWEKDKSLHEMKIDF